MTRDNKIRAVAAIAFLCFSVTVRAQEKQKQGTHSKHELEKPDARAVLWSDPADLSSRDLFYGEGGKEDAPTSTTFTYIKEDLNGTSPKFDVRDDNGVKWRVKLGEEARPETVATRLLWAVGYFVDEDYFLPEIQVQEIQPVSKKRRKRVIGLLEANGEMHNVRLKRYSKDRKKVDEWEWKHNQFTGTRELNGLRVMMALINNWDLKDSNNSIYAEKTIKEEGQGDSKEKEDLENVYVVSDLGASFGTIGRVRKRELAKGNLDSYHKSKFIRRIGRDYVDFNVPAREAWPLAVNPKEYFLRLRLRWIGRHIPRADAKWIGQLLAQLSEEQVRDAFRAAGYPPEQVDAFTTVVEQRIAQLSDL